GLRRPPGRLLRPPAVGAGNGRRPPRVRSACAQVPETPIIPLLSTLDGGQAHRITTESNTKRLHMYAVLVTGGKQYRVAQGETLRVEKLEAEAGNEITFDNILMLGGSDGVTVGDALKGASVTAKVVGHGRADKVRIIKFRRRKHHMKRQGHRQHYTE